jgi:membrane protease YdiL (CAAX protease family)
VEINIWAIYFLFLMGIVVPIGAIKSNQRLKRDQFPSRRVYFGQLIGVQMALLALSILVAVTNHIGLFPRPTLLLKDVFAGAIFLALGIGTLFVRWRFGSGKISAERKQRLKHLVPESFKEKWLWLALCLMAAIAEEVGYRGVMFTLFMRIAGDWWIAATISALLFALGHMVQGWKSAISIFFFAFGFHVLVLISGALYTAMVVHFLYDITAGVILGRVGNSINETKTICEPTTA